MKFFCDMASAIMGFSKAGTCLRDTEKLLYCYNQNKWRKRVMIPVCLDDFSTPGIDDGN